MNKLRILRFMVPMHAKNEWGLSMNLRFVLVVLLVLVLDWWFVFEDEDEWVHGPNARSQGREGFP
jgi:hypothetical protein